MILDADWQIQHSSHGHAVTALMLNTVSSIQREYWYICSNSQQYIVWVKIIKKILLYQKSLDKDVIKIFCKFANK